MDAEARNRIVSIAREQVGKPFTYHVKISAQMKSFDCSALVTYCYFKAGIYLPRYTVQIIDYGKLIEPSDIQAADLVLFKGEGHDHPLFKNGVGHIAIYTGNDEIIEAFAEEVIVHYKKFEGRVRIRRLSERIKDETYRGILRIPD